MMIGCMQHLFVLAMGAAAFEFAPLAFSYSSYFIFFWVFSLGFFAHFLYEWGEENVQSVGWAVCRFDCSLHRCQLATVRLAAFQWN